MRMILTRSKIWILILSTLMLLTAIAIAFNYWVFSSQVDIVVEASGRGDTKFRVFYIENDIFPDNPISQDMHFLMSFTDFVEIDSSFSAQFSENVNIDYSYTATKSLIISYMFITDGNLNPTIFEVSHILSADYGRTIGNEINLPMPSINGDRGTYTISFDEYIAIYLDFIDSHTEQIEQHNLIPQNMRGFSAELLVEFTYEIYIPSWGIRDSITQGYSIPLTNEIYSFTPIGTSTFNQSVILVQADPINLPLIVVFAIIFALCAYGFFNEIKKLQADPNERKQEALTILKKYDNEIVSSMIPLLISKYNNIPVEEFKTLLKMSVYLNKHIMCYHDDEMAEFAVILEEYAYYFKIEYTIKSEDLKNIVI